MYSQLVIIHRPRQEEQASTSDFKSRLKGHTWTLWETCVRKMAFASVSDLDLQNLKNELNSQLTEIDQLFVGEEAYRFLLEVVCGLHSPVKGETEVHGQYKQFVDTLNPGHSLIEIFKKVHQDARKVRTHHLQGLGSQSYGSHARKKMRGIKSVHILGAGHLTREILPWLAKLALEIHLYTRSPEKNADLTEKYSSLKLFSLNKAPKELSYETALLISAPTSAGFVGDWATEVLGQYKIVLDYRAESKFDPIQNLSSYYNLEDIFREIGMNKAKVDSEVAKAKELIQSICA